ncbi:MULTISPECIES: trypsin-like peptidase domain-containing protein [unclassified Streptomyces]|uniref:VMAP-C domain-containing protein n=1 Tax=unclassified Streptomyces TaxID=2593676 RepID=UPI00226F98AC|nr:MULTISPECIES: trypsin-like peptidase domain-containing protein [unclassified Streptomyces]MCY0920237.1 trypsin-like peptidase domain-containing protein [Streptomyces sp. H27-G5]MCY0956691.1 trypsin-like peptidase domain-containing protein [Streptomyces sp. H27-H5]
MQDGRTGGAARAFELLEPLVRAATVRVHAAPDGYALPGSHWSGPTWGSGFFIAPGWVLTCAHVIGEGGAAVRLVGREVGISFFSGGAAAGIPGAAAVTGTVAGRVECVLPDRLEERRPGRGALWDLPDLALIRVLAPVSHACVWLTDRARPRIDEAAYFGCTEDLGMREITGRTTRLRGTAGGGAAIRLGDEDEIEPGMSGGPVVDLARGEVIGVIKARRHAGGGGLAVSVAQLRTLPMAATGQIGLYRRVMQAHDLYHYDQHLSDLNSRRTWTDVHDELPGDEQDPYGSRGRLTRLTPAERTTLCGLLAELPPPGSSEAVRSLAEAARGEEPDTGLPAPLSWRDGLGLLHDPPGAGGEAAAMLRYATDVSVADHREPPSPGADEELWDWVRTTAERLWRPLRRELGERRDRGLADRELRRRARAGQTAPGRARAAGGLPAGPSVLLEVWAHSWEEVYDWRVSVLTGPQRVTPLDSGTRVSPARLPAASRAALAEGFRRCDTHEAVALLEVAVAPELFGLAVDEWPVAGGIPVGVQRPVVFRHPGDGAERDAGAAGPGGRWARVQEGPLQGRRADCFRGRQRSPSPAWLAALVDNTVPVLCRDAAAEPTLGALYAVRDAGYGVLVCRRPPADPGQSCAPFHRGLREELAEAGRAAVLPLRLKALRSRAHGADPDAYWAAGMTLVWEDPGRALPQDEPLQGDL